MMKHLNPKAEVIFRRLTEGMVEVGDHRKWDNAKGTFMAACVEIIGQAGLGPLVSVAHYYEQNGDLMRDPDCVFIVGADQHVYPISYRQDGLGIDQEAAYVEDGKWKIKPKMQADIATFCNQWMLNIAEQQDLGNETTKALDQRIESAFNAADAAHAQTQETLRQLEESLKPKTADEASESRVWRCPECGMVDEFDGDWLSDHGEPICPRCDVDMKLQPKDKGI
jgi:rubrerythrin